MTSDALTKLGDFIDVKHGFAFKGGHFVDSPTCDIVVTPGNFAIGGGFQADKAKYYDGPIPEDYILHPGDLIVTMTDLSKAGDTLGYPAIIPDSNAVRYLHNQRIGLVQIKEGVEADSRFLFYRLCADDYRHHILATASGSTVRHTSPGRICEFETELPHLGEQRAIAAALGSLDDKIEQNRRTCGVMEQLARAIFQAWFVDFEPVKAKAAGATAFPSIPQDVFDTLPTEFQDSELGPIPQGWEVKAIAKIATFLNGLAMQKHPPRGDGRDIPVIKIAQLRKGSTEGASWANGDVPEDYVIHDRDLLFSWSGTLEATFWFGGIGGLNQHLFKVSSSRFPGWFCLLWIKHHLPWFRAIAASKATTMGHIKRQHLQEAEVVIPSSEMLTAADTVIGALYDLHAQTMVECRALGRMRDYLLPKLISGAVRVNVEGGADGI
ncbi:MAG: restriction endonuclease subunit S [Planctomycetes bacterium]|nr:restriction endonuclease subunit S [Planctomycetota bacterium]NOG53329.1 restriction endonuclease subunit S [Planctomycetota bacterium]